MDIISISVALWVLFAFIMLSGALFTKRTAERQDIKSRLAYVIPFIISFLLMANSIGGKIAPGTGLGQPIYPLYVQIIPNILPIMIVGMAMALAGLIVLAWARITLGSNWSGSVELKEKQELVENGPYAFVRHPIYSGLLLLYLGTAIVIGNLGSFIGFPILFISCWIKPKQEEELMTKYFKNEYIKYMKRTKRLVPYLI